MNGAVSLVGMVVVIVLFIIGLARNGRRNEEGHAEAVRRVIEERARLESGAPRTPSDPDPTIEQ